MGIRNLNNTLRDSLLQEEPFVYAHLVKFEKPIKTLTGRSGRRQDDYVYVTDGSFDIVFDDGSESATGTANGAQVYVANKLVSVGSVSETIEARATSMSLQVSAAALSTSTSGSFTTTSSTISGDEDLVDKGFREGDILKISGANNNGKTVRIEQFENNNTRIVVTAQNSSLTSETNQNITLTFSSPEVEGILSDRSDNAYARYINRDVFIYKAHINTDTGAIIGAPYLLFKGIIASGKLSEDPSKSSVLSWQITSHWGDFSRVQGRLTADQYHRALDQNNNPDPEAAIRPAYAGDLGFLHSEQAINLVSIYQVQETRYKLKKKSSWFGLKKSYSQVEYQVEVDREADLRFNLEAKYLPIVYGVNKIDSIPIFVDTLNTNSKKVFVAYALCEGEIGGLYDIYFDDTSSICIDENDSSTRSTQTTENTIDVLCSGRADRGDTLTPQSIAGTNYYTAYGTTHAMGRGSWRPNIAGFYTEYGYFPPRANLGTGASTQGSGITDGKGTSFSTPIDTRLFFHSGKPNQKADTLLLANSSNFKVGTDYYDGEEPYWGANHRLLDTAYVVAEYTIGEGETSIPSLDFVVRGKGTKSYNYDFSYAQDPAFAGSDAASSSFNIGQSVTLKYTGTPTLTIATATIADIYTITNVSGIVETRIRFTENPGIHPFTEFFIQDGSNEFHLVTYDHVSHSGTIPETLEETITSVSNNAGGGVNAAVTNPNSAVAAAFNFADTMAIFEDQGYEFDAQLLNEFIATFSNNEFVNIGATQVDSSEIVSETIVVTDAIKLGTGSSSVDNAYNGYEVELSQTLDNGDVRVQTKTVIDYLGSEKILKVDTPFEYLPRQGDTYKIYSTNDDIRISTNPAIQLLDYLQSPRYGRNLDIETDLDKESFLATARACDTRSNVFMLLHDSPTIGATYKYATSNGKTLWQGKVKTRTSITLFSTTHYVVEFEDVLGKLVHRWENWKYFYTGELYYKSGKLHKASSDGNINTYSAGSNIQLSLSIVNTTNSSDTLSVDIARRDTNGNGIYDTPSDIYTADGDPVIKKVGSATSVSSGYTMYDSDDVKYWRYLGWEAQNQRHVTRHQTNAVIDTSKPIFDNINSMLNHFNGILRYSAGKYSLAIKTASEDATTVTVDGTAYTIENIDEDDIIGSINVEDAGQKGTFNQVDVSINDPQNRFEGRSVMMFNSTYLKEDRMVPKKGNVRSPYITNYYNARINAKQYLDGSRAALKINFTMAPRGVLLQAGDIIRINYPRFGWTTTNTFYRITNLNIQENCLIQVTAEEHNDSAYLIEAAESGLAGIRPAPGVTAPLPTPAAPENLNATVNDRGGIELSWTQSTDFNAATYAVQIWRSDDNDRSNAVLVGTSKGDRYTDQITAEGRTVRYYWVRYAVAVPPQTTTQSGLREIFSDYNPASETGGVEGISEGAVDGLGVFLTNDNASIATLADGSLSFLNTGTTVTASIGANELTYDDTTPYANNSFRVASVTVSSGVTIDSTPTTTSNSYILGDITNMTTTSGTVAFNVIITNSLGQQSGTITRIQTLTVSGTGEKGEPGGPGDKGDKGDKGEKGLKGVRGDGGDKGDKGIKGDLGAKGVRGDGGDKGDTGLKGDLGAKGVEGDGGDKGDPGDKGDLGAKGTEGDVGDKGLQGAKGDQGPKGDLGPKGTEGDVGDKGSTGQKGTDGDKGLQGEKGGEGAKGAGGDKGLKGDLGVKGSTGQKGTDGDKGLQGEKGGQGAKGDTGQKGDTGPKGGEGDGGDKGTKGDTGPKGTTGVKGDPGEDVLIIYYAGLANDNLNSNATVNKNNAPTAPNMNGGSSAISGAFRLTQADGTVTNWYSSSVGLNVFFVASAVVPAFNQAPTSEWTVSGFLQGDKGDKGALGEKGVKGIVGEKGDQGAKGVIGAKGGAGDKGLKGDVGLKGTTGTKGNEGDKGSSGQKGDTGAKGVGGDKGGKGDVGLKGTTGPKGNEGDKGSSGTKGATGAKGVGGDKGGKGDTGTKGTTGAKGDTGAKGSTGAKGGAGAKGGKGDAGAKGAAGQKGDQGDKGGKGDTGAKGSTGAKGNQGDKGGKGDVGAKGDTGQKGDTGPKGITGVKGGDGSPGADAPYVVIGFNSAVDTNAERVAAIKSFSGLTTVLNNSVYWDAVSGIPYQNQGASAASPTLTALSGGSGIISMDSIKLQTGNQRVELSASGLKIYNSNVLRVKIGDLS